MPYLVLVLISLFFIINRSEVLMKDLCLPAEAAIDKAMLTYDPEEQIDGPDPITVVSRTNDGTVLDVATIDIDESAWVTDSTVSTTPLTSQGEQVVPLPNLCNNVYVTVNVPLIKRLYGVTFSQNVDSSTAGIIPLTSFTYTSVAINNISLAVNSCLCVINTSNADRYVIGVKMTSGSSSTYTVEAGCYYYYLATGSNYRVNMFVLDANHLSDPVYYCTVSDNNTTDSNPSFVTVSKSVLLVSTD